MDNSITTVNYLFNYCWTQFIQTPSVKKSLLSLCLVDDLLNNVLINLICYLRLRIFNEVYLLKSLPPIVDTIGLTIKTFEEDASKKAANARTGGEACFS